MPSSQVPTTLHSGWELLMARQGQVSLTWTGGSETIDAGQIAIIPPNTAHELATTEGFDFCALRIDSDELQARAAS